MSFTSLISRLFQGSGRVHAARPSSARRSAQFRSFVPRLTALEDRSVPSASPLLTAPHQEPIKESLTIVSVSNQGVYSYEGQASHFGHVTAVSYQDNSFIKTAANGDQVVGYLTPAT